jgi:Fe-S oxidoreductase/nitrate reductase gamma subunit
VLLATETREVFQGLGPGAEVLFYLLASAATGVFAWGWVRRVKKYRQGRSADRVRLRGNGRKVGGQSIVDSLYAVASNKTVRRRHNATGLAHLLVFWGFITLFIGTVILTIDYDIVRNATRLIGGEEKSFFQGVFYAVYSFVLDTMGLAAVGGLAYLIGRRAFGHNSARDYTRAEQPDGGYSRRDFVRGDWLFLVSLLLVLVTGFLHEGLRIRASGFPTFEVWSVGGWAIAKAARGVGITEQAAGDARLVLWWLHIGVSLAFVAYIPWSKAMHMVTDAANLVTTEPGAARSLPKPVAVDHVGYRVLADFTWKQLLDLDSCTKCGRCHEVCPAAASGAPLSPRDLILDLRQWVEVSSGGRTLLDGERRPTATGPLAAANGHGGDTRIAGDVITAETLWACTTCMACIEACPVGIEHVPTIVELRRSLVDDGTMEPTLQTALQNITQQGNSFGKSSRMRARWTKGLDTPIKDVRKEPAQHLWFVGDFASFDERLQDLSRSLARILTGAGVDFGILYEDEWNAGNDVRRVGEEGLFELLVEHNIAAFAAADFVEIFTTDPHSFNTLRNEYPAYGLEKPVKHYTELLADLLESGAIAVQPLGVKVTYHDPCYLARYNRQTDAPRRVLAALGCELVEMPRNRENTFCCGAGGGRIWMDDSGLTERPSENRIREAATLDVGRFVVACPKDFTMYSDAAKTTGHDDRLRVVDVVQLVEEALAVSPLMAVQP